MLVRQHFNVRNKWKRRPAAGEAQQRRCQPSEPSKARRTVNTTQLAQLHENERAT
jgi:hypothetical protein